MEHELINWLVKYNDELQVIETLAECPLAAFKCQVIETFKLTTEDTNRLELRTNTGILLDKDSETLLVYGTVPEFQIIVTLKPKNSQEALQIDSQSAKSARSKRQQSEM